MEIKKEVLFSIVELLGSEELKKDVISTIDGLESEDTNLFESIESKLISFNNDRNKELISKGYRQEAKKTERLIKEVFTNVDFEGKRKDEMLTELRDKYKLNSDSKQKDSKKITLQEALKVPEIQSHFESLQGKANEYENLNKEFESYKNLQSVKGYALEVLPKIGAKFSSNERLKTVQQQELEKLLSTLPHKIVDNKVVVLDEDGDPLNDPNTSKPFEFENYLKNNVALEFEQPKETPKDNNPHVPKDKGGSNSFGYSKEKLKSLTYEDYNAAKQQGKPQEADFIAGVIKENLNTLQK